MAPTSNILDWLASGVRRSVRRQPNYLSERIQTEDPLGREVAAIGMNVAEGALRDGGWPVHMVNFSNRL
jgi:hypothetical protein